MPPARRPLTTVRDWIGGLPSAGTSGDPLHDHWKTRAEGISRPAPRASLNADPDNPFFF
jgi:hypothetical protein